MVVITAPLTTSSGIRDIFIAENNHYALVATTSGVEVVDLYKGRVVSSGIVPGGFAPTCIAADWVASSGVVYVGTSGGGIFTTRYHPIRGYPTEDFSNLLIQQFSTSTTPALSSDVVQDLDYQPGRLLVGTSSGTDFIFQHSNRSTKAVVGGVSTVHLTADGVTGYWTTGSSVQVNYGLPSTIGGGIIGVDFEYTTLSNPSLPSKPPTDIAIAEASPRALAFATPSGVLVVEEKPLVESTANRKTFVDPNEFSQTPTPSFVSVDFSSTATYSGGLLYAVSSGTLRLFGLINNTLSGTHPQRVDPLFNNLPGIPKKQLVSSGTLTLVRTTSVPA